MNWDECIASYDVKEIQKNKETAKAFLKLCKARMEVANNMDKEKHAALLTESYYEVIKELILGLMSIHGYKSYTHVCFISFLSKFYSSDFSNNEIDIVDKLRRIRNELDYLGIFKGKDFIHRNEKRIIGIIGKLTGLVESKVD
jgi:hypothetical protein